MNPFVKYARYGFLTILFLLTAVSVSVGEIIKWPDSSRNSQDLLLLGFGEVIMQSFDVSGNEQVFEESNPSLKADFFSNYRFSLFTNGGVLGGLSINGAAIVDSRIDEEYYTYDPSVFRLRMSAETTEPIWDGWRFTGRGLYDPARQWELGNLDKRLLTQPQEPARLELLMRLESDEYGYIEGGSLRPSFKGSKFSLHQRSIFGIYTDLHSGPVGAEAVAGKLEGKAFREGDVVGIRADGTSGPYDLSYAPITRGSEEIKIEVRDRFNETTVLSSETLIRDIDYTVDNLLGRIYLNQPVASETVSSDPVYIVITYDYLREEDDDIVGGRIHVMPDESIQASGTYIHRNIDDGAVGAGEEEPENLIAGDISVQIDEHTTGYFEISGSENRDDEDNYSAIRVGAETSILKNVKLNADFQRIDDDFRSFTNSDLNPNKNQQRFNLGGSVQLTEKQNLNASYVNLRGLEANGDYNTYDGLLEEEILNLGYRNNLMKPFGFGVRLERRDKIDRSNTNLLDNYQNRLMADVDGTLDVPVLKELDYGVDYEMIMFRNETGIGDNDANTNQIALSLAGRPVKDTELKFAQRLSIRKDKELDLYDERQDVTFASAGIRPHEDLNTYTTYEYKRFTRPGNSIEFWQSNPFRVIRAMTFAAEYLPLEKIKTIGKFGRVDTRYWVIDTTSRTIKDFILGQVTYFHTHHLSFDGETEYQQTDTRLVTRSKDKTWDIGLKVNWNKNRLNEFTAGMIRRWQCQDYSTGSEITSTSYIMLLSGSVSFMHKFFARGSIKGILLNDPLNDEKTFAKAEIGYDSFSWYRVSLGYERIEGETDDYPDQNYTGQGVFLRFTGKM